MSSTNSVSSVSATNQDKNKAGASGAKQWQRSLNWPARELSL